MWGLLQGSRRGKTRRRMFRRTDGPRGTGIIEDQSHDKSSAPVRSCRSSHGRPVWWVAARHDSIRRNEANIQGYEYIHTSQEIMGQLPEFSVHAQRKMYRHRKVAGSGPRSPAITSGSRSITLHFLVWGELWIRTPLVDVAHGVDIVFPSYR